MKWGIRRTREQLGNASSSEKGPSKHTVNMANKDAKRFADAKMFYGKTAGTKRKLLKAELERKKKTIDGYEEAFDKAVENVDYSKSAKKAVRTRHTIDAVYRTRVTTKQILGVTGPLTVAAGMAIYQKNKSKVDAFVVNQFRKAASMLRR